jgi:tetratricopeptide (TPR) repeat protein
MTSANDNLSHLLQIAQTHLRLGHFSTLVGICNVILSLDRHNTEALMMLGAVARHNKNLPLALKLTEAALAVNINLTSAWFNRGLILHDMGHPPEALQSANEAVRLDTRYPEAWHLLGTILREMGQSEQALASYAQAYQLRSHETSFAIDYAQELYGHNKLAEAYNLLHDIVARDDKVLPLTFANILKNAGYPERALPYLARTRTMLPNGKEVILNEAMALLQIGRYAEAWKAWEQRPDLDARFHHLPLWQGKTVDHLLVYEDQGFGDVLLVSRYISMVTQRVAQLTLQIPSELQKLFQHNFPNIKIIALSDPVPAAKARVRMMSLPSIFDTRADTIPAYSSPLTADEAVRHSWRERLSAVATPRIGFVWGGNTSNPTDPIRSLPVGLVPKLVEENGHHFVSLQKGKHKDDVDLSALGVVDAAPDLNNFDDTAALIAELDLVITTCTSMAHLAGAMGKPTWLMLCFDPYWVWMLGREDSPWYPSLRLFRQTVPGNWDNVVEDVTVELSKFIAGDKNTLVPTRHVGPPMTQNPHALQLLE